MLVSTGTTIAVADGAKLTLFRNIGTAEDIDLEALPAVSPDETHAGSGGRHFSGSRNPDDSTQAEDDFSAGIGALLNSQVENGEIKRLVLVAAPRALGEIRRHYSKQTANAVVSELAKDLTGHTSDQIAQALQAAA